MAFTFKVKKRCRFCGTVLREDGTCPKQTCPRYVPDKPKEEPAQEASTKDAATEPSEEVTK